MLDVEYISIDRDDYDELCEWTGDVSMPFSGVAIGNRLYSSPNGYPIVLLRNGTGSGIEGEWSEGGLS